MNMKYLINNVNTVLNFNGASYCIFFTINVCINKFILSSFKFTYPTVLQGWQTVMTTLIVVVLKSTNKEKFKESVHAPGFSIFVPHLLLHVLQLVTGSKALSLLPVPVFLCGINSSDALINLILKSNNRMRNLIGCIIIIASGIVVLWKYYELTKIGAGLWFVAYIMFFSADSLYCGLVDMKVNRFSRLFYINLFSAIALVPLSVISNEIYSAVEFSSANGFLFRVCFLMSGVCAGATQLLALWLHSRKMSHSIATALAACLAHLAIYDATLTYPLFHIILVNLATSVLLSQDDSSLDYSKLELELV